MKDGHTLRLKIRGDGNIGLFCVATEKFCLVPNIVTEKQHADIASVLGVDVHRASVGYTNFVGIFIAGNSNGIVVSGLIEDEEKRFLEKELGINVCALNSRYNALGNLIVANDNGAAISPIFTIKQKNAIRECLGVEAISVSASATPLTGSACLANKRGVLLHPGIRENEKSLIESVLKVKSMPGTLGLGSPWVGAVGICNSSGMVTGTETTIHEIVRADEALGFV
ncbi:MAG: translation initiation factor IF-6 [Candidatus Aenigmatarchaeota archaeon]